MLIRKETKNSNNTTSANYSKKYVIIFIFVALMSGWIGVLIDTFIPNQPDEQTLGMGLWLILPFLCGIIIRILNKDWNDIGVKTKMKGNIKWYVLSISIFPLITFIYSWIAWFFGLVRFSEYSYRSVGTLIISILFALLIKNIFEDFAWQGFLTPKLTKINISDFKIYLIVGLVWAFWHAPYYLFFLPESFYASSSVRLMDIFIVSPIVITIWAVLFVEMTRITKSVWPAVLMHTIEDAIPNLLIFEEKVIIFEGFGKILFNPINGVFPLLTFLLIGLWIRKKRISKDIFLS